ncbi:uncharacterized protein LOC142317612 [Lycorma delicatula]|uniref:uncharacterized protein LOC142317612 n=1 Tax=Lycorma delicatula TaxID=130591 RepID=UPI003F51451E
MQNEHVRLLHTGQQLLLASVRLKFYGKSTAKKITYQCVTCFKVKPKSYDQLMDNLPKERVQPARPFLNSGVDYYGPVSVCPSHKRGVAPVKAYITIFVCLATRAVHIELVSALTTEAFLGALEQFMSRQGKCAHFQTTQPTSQVQITRILKGSIT